MMTNDNGITWCELDRGLRGLGYEVATVPGSHRVYHHPKRDDTIILPDPKTDSPVSRIHLAVVQSHVAESDGDPLDDFAERLRNGNGMGQSS